MICIIALIVFSILGIFSASHREIAKEAFDCVFRRITFRPCISRLDQRLKGQILGKIVTRSETAARFVNKYFEVISWGFLVLMIGSTVFSIQGGINYYLYGNCNGLNNQGFCVFDPTGNNNKISAVNTECSVPGLQEASLTLEPLTLSEFPTKPANSPDTLVFIGCYGCEYTRKTYPTIQELIKKNQVNYTFVHFPVKGQTKYLSNYGYCINKQSPEKFWQFNNQLFSTSLADIERQEHTDTIVSNLGLNVEEIKACVNNQETQAIIDKRLQQVEETGIYGTPTIFVNGQPLVGPKPYRVYARMLSTSIFSKVSNTVNTLVGKK